MEVAAVVSDVPGGSGRSLEVTAVILDVQGGSGRSREVVVWHGSPCHKDFLILLNVVQLRKFILF